MKSLLEIKLLVDRSRSRACNEAHRSAKVPRSRGAYLMALDFEGRSISGDGDNVLWNGTLKEIKSFLYYYILKGMESLSIFGGYDGHKTVQWDDLYEPWISEWECEFSLQELEIEGEGIKPRFRIDFQAVDGPYSKTAESLREAGEVVLDYVGNYDGFVSFDGIVRCIGILAIYADGERVNIPIQRAVNLALENAKS